MLRRSISFAGAVVCGLLAIEIASFPANAQVASDKPTVLKLDPALDELISSDAQLQLVHAGFGFSEGITWVQSGNYLLLSDIPANVIYKMTPDGDASVFLEHSGYQGYDVWRVGHMQANGADPKAADYEQFPLIGSNGLALDGQGRLVIASGGGRSIDRINRDGKRTTLAATYEGKRFNGTNDVRVKRDGTIYFTDNYTALRGGDKDPDKGVDFAGIYMLKDGKVTRIAEDISTPNGLAFSPDERTFYANGSSAKYVRAYDVLPDDTLINGRMLIDVSGDPAPGITDGIKVDTSGNIWESGPGGIWIVSPQGKHLGTIFTPTIVGNLEFGDPDHKTLYIAARPNVYKIRLNVEGIP